MKKTLTCCACGEPMWKSPKSRPQGDAKCHRCRRLQRPEKPDQSHKKTLRCADCGQPMWQGRTSRPQGQARCLPCRRANPPSGPSSQPIKSRGFCAGCAQWFESTGSRVRFCSIQCHNRATAHLKPQSQAPLIACPVCGEMFKRTHDRTTYCSKRCYGASRSGDGCWPDGTWAWRSFVDIGPCLVCGAMAAAQRGKTRTCGNHSSYEIHRNKFIAAAHRRQTRLKAVYVEDVNPLVVYERDGWVCHLCGDPVLREPRHKRDPLMASLDHIVPISLGGEHSYANVACSHYRCNLSKGARVAA